MMFLKPLAETGILYRFALSPLDADQVMAANKRIIEGTFPGFSLSSPQWIDFTQMDLLKYSSDNLKQLIRSRTTLGAAKPGPIALVVKNESSFGMARMFSIYSDVMGLRDEALHLITVDDGEAAEWLLNVVGIRDFKAADLVQMIRDLRDQALREAGE